MRACVCVCVYAFMCVFVPEARLVNKTVQVSCLSGMHHWPAAATLRANKVTNESERVRGRARERHTHKDRDKKRTVNHGGSQT